MGLNSNEQRREKLYTGLEFHFSKSGELKEIYNGKKELVDPLNISFLRNLIKIGDENSRIMFADLEQYIEVLSPRFGKKSNINTTSKGMVVSNINIH